jgi:hypothetical protein
VGPIAVALITIPKAMVRLSARREQMDQASRALCFEAVATSIFYGDQSLTTSSLQAEADRKLLKRLGMRDGGGPGYGGERRGYMHEFARELMVLMAGTIAARAASKVAWATALCVAAATQRRPGTYQKSCVLRSVKKSQLMAQVMRSPKRMAN